MKRGGVLREDVQWVLYLFSGGLFCAEEHLLLRGQWEVRVNGVQSQYTPQDIVWKRECCVSSIG